MNTAKFLVVAAFAAASAAAMAQSTGQEGSPLPQTLQPGATSAQVQSELASYQASGVNPWSTSYNQLAGFASQRTRADVRAEYLASRNEVAALTREDSGSAYLAQLAARHQAVATNLAGQPANGAR